MDLAVGDPWDWPVDRIVQELCTENRSWQPRSASLSRPEPIALEQNLREQEITGDVLLFEVDDNILKDEFGIKVLNRRAFIRNAIDQFRRRSPKYQSYLQTTAHQNFSLQQASGIGSIVTSSHTRGLTNSNAPLVATENGGANEQLEAAQPLVASAEIYSGVPDSKRRKIDGDSPAEMFGTQCCQIEASFDERPGYTLTSNSPPAIDTSSVEINEKKRKRIAPINITPVIDPNRQRDILTGADDVVMNRPQNVPSIGASGKKRIEPTVVVSYVPNAELDQFYAIAKSDDAMHFDDPKRANGSKSKVTTKQEKDSLAIGYLGKQKMPVDDIFYKDVKVGEELPPLAPPNGCDDVSFGLREISIGRRIYVHNIMKHYLREQRQDFARGGKRFSAVLPHSTTLKPRFQRSSFTLFYMTADSTVHAMRAEVSSWPEIDPEAINRQSTVFGEDRSVKFNLPSLELEVNVGSYADWDPSILEKYLHLDGGDEILPLYGESDSENEFDEKLWAEIEAEQGLLPKPTKVLKRPLLSIEELNAAIDKGISQIMAKWKNDKLPKLQLKRFKIWQKSRKQKTWKKEIEEAQFRLTHILERVSNMRSEIQKDIWTSERQVLKQTPVMQLDIYFREELRWKISLLEQRNSPEMPPQTLPLPGKKTKSKPDNIDGESLESDSEDFSSDDDLGDFIVADDSANEEEQVLNLADEESSDDGETSDSDENMFGPARPPVTPNKKTIVDLRGLLRQSGSSSTQGNPQPLKSKSTLTPSSIVSVGRGQGILSRKAATKLGNQSNMIDLTGLSSDADDRSALVDLTTSRKSRLMLHYKSANPITITDDDGSDESPLLPAGLVAIAIKSRKFWEVEKNRKKMLLWVICHMKLDLRKSILEFIKMKDFSENYAWGCLIEITTAFDMKDKHVKGIDDRLFLTLTIFIQLYEVFIDCKWRPLTGSLSSATIKKLKSSQLKWFSPFCTFCKQIPSYFEGEPLPPASPPEFSLKKRKGYESSDEQQDVSVDRADQDEEDGEDGEPLTAVKRRLLGRSKLIVTEDNATPVESPRKKKKLLEDASARNLREQDQLRLAQQEERRKKLQNKLGHSQDEEMGQIIVNDAKSDEQGYIYINPTIARQIKKHQIEGLRFMWNQIVGEEKSSQGCLLAHTMGLGKTMQTITLLVTIAEASASNDPTVVSQIPERLRKSRSLVLCPPGLIDNWMDELLTWSPETLLGNLIKLNDIKKVPERIQEINTWHEEGGILILGYEMFRNFILNKKTTTRDQPLNEGQHDQVKRQLLQGPNIIIADEAHKMKNSTSGLNTSASDFESNSRIALTGSPLANNIEEYHAMINWVAPNYLGPIAEFRQKYVQPIQSGLWKDSTAYERRKCLKMLGVLKEDISPKVHRADMAVLRNDLPPKKEFVIYLALTPLQTKAYTIYVRSMLSGAGYARTKDGEVAQTTMWHWLGILSLLCNHPYCFNAKLNERKDDAKKEIIVFSRDATDQEDTDTDIINQPVWKTGISRELILEEKTLFEEVVDLWSIELSNKVKILCQLLDACKAVKDKVLVFSSSIPTLDFLEGLCKKQRRNYTRLDGKTAMSTRQDRTKAFNKDDTELYLISTSAGGLGLNLFGANRVIIFDFKWNPILEEQAVGRAYRIGQKKDTFIYRFVAGGTFEDTIHNKTVFKTQLASRVVDKKNPLAYAKKKISEFLFKPRDVEQEDLSQFEGMDPLVLDHVLESEKDSGTIRAIVQSDTFERVDEDKLTAEEEKEVRQLVSDQKLKRSDPGAWAAAQELANARLQAAMGPQPVNSLPSNRIALSGTQRHGGTQVTPIRPPPKFQGATFPLNAPPPQSNDKSPLDVLTNDSTLVLRDSPEARVLPPKVNSNVTAVSRKLSENPPPRNQSGTWAPDEHPAECTTGPRLSNTRAPIPTKPNETSSSGRRNVFEIRTSSPQRKDRQPTTNGTSNNLTNLSPGRQVSPQKHSSIKLTDIRGSSAKPLSSMAILAPDDSLPPMASTDPGRLFSKRPRIRSVSPGPAASHPHTSVPPLRAKSTTRSGVLSTGKNDDTTKVCVSNTSSRSADIATLVFKKPQPVLTQLSSTDSMSESKDTRSVIHPTPSTQHKSLMSLDNMLPHELRDHLKSHSWDQKGNRQELLARCKELKTKLLADKFSKSRTEDHHYQAVAEVGAQSDLSSSSTPI